MRVIARLLVVGVCFGSMWGQAWAQAPSERCNALAASPFDLATPPGTGINFDDIDAQPAIEACAAAVKAAPDDARLRFQLGRAEDAAGDYASARADYEAALGLGSVAGGVALARLYEDGRGVDKDYGRAFELYTAGAAAGSVLALEALGDFYEHGRGVEQDYKLAAKNYASAAELGSVWAMAALGWLTENGWGVVADDVKAAELYRKAADGGIDFAQNNLGSFYDNGKGGLAKDPVTAHKYFEMAAAQGYPLAFSNLGRHYAEGIGVERDVEKAESYLRKAIAEGDDDLKGMAANSLAYLFATEKTNLKEAEALARSSVDAAPADANRLDTLAWVLHGAGRSSEALPIMEKAVALDPASQTFQDHLEAIKAAAGQ